MQTANSPDTQHSKDAFSIPLRSERLQALLQQSAADTARLQAGRSANQRSTRKDRAQPQPRRVPRIPRDPLIAWDDVVRAFSLALAEAGLTIKDTRDWAPLMVQTRISRLEAGTSTSPERQLGNVCRWCVAFKFFPVHLTHEETSGAIYRRRRRYAFEQAYDDIANDRITDPRSGELVKHIACFLYDRFTRDPEEGGDWLRLLRQKGANLYETYYGEDPLPLYRLEHSIRESWNLASKEVERDRERIMDALLRRAMLGLPSYGTEFAFGHRRVRDADGRVVGYKAEPEQAAIVHAKALEIINGASLYSVLCWLNDNGIKNSAGNTWSYEQVRRLFTSPRIAGLVRLRIKRERLHDPNYKGDLFPVELIYEEGQSPARTFDPPIEPLVSYPLWVALGETIESRQTKRGARAVYFASGYMTCGTCAAKLIGGKSRRAPVYRCGKRHLLGVSRPNGSASTRKSQDGKTHPTVRGLATELLLEEIMFAAVDARTEEQTVGPLDLEAETSRINSALGDLDQRQSDLSHMLWDRRIDRQTFDQWSTGLDEERVRLNEHRKALKKVRSTLIPEGLTLREIWPDLSLERRRQWLDAVFESIVVHPAEKTGRIELHGRFDFAFRDGYQPPQEELDALILRIENQAQREIAKNVVAQELEHRIFEMWRTGKSTIQIGVALRAEGVPAPRQGRWGPNSITFILRRVCAERGIEYTPNFSDLSKIPLEVRELMLELYLQLKCHADVGRELNRLGLRRPSGGAWDSCAVSDALKKFAKRRGIELPTPQRPSSSPGHSPHLSAAMRERVWRMRRVDGKKLGDIAKWLQRNKIKSASGRLDWSIQKVASIVYSMDKKHAAAALEMQKAA